MTETVPHADPEHIEEKNISMMIQIGPLYCTRLVTACSTLTRKLYSRYANQTDLSQLTYESAGQQEISRPSL